MIRKLRYKFIIINMTFVIIMFAFIFGYLYISTVTNIERESIQMMQSIAMNPRHVTSPSGNFDKAFLPYFSMLVNQENESIEVTGGFYDLSDEALLEEILQQTLSADSDVGVLKEYGLRFIRSQTPMGLCYVYADMTSEKSIIANLIRNLAIIGAVAMIAFLGISYLLSGWAVKPVEEAWKQQKQFVADASHELKTPLTVIMTDAELLHAPDCRDEERVQLSAAILAMSDQMRGLVESLLKLARLDNGQLKKEMGTTDFSKIAADSAMMFEPLFFEKGLSLTYDIEPDLSLQANGTQLKQLVDILLDNAAKYSSPGGETTLTLKKSSSKKCRLTVSNQGEPISEEDLKNLFKRFYRADKSRTQNHSYGLGLSIAESIVKDHGGHISAESRDGLNTFLVTL